MVYGIIIEWAWPMCLDGLSPMNLMGLTQELWWAWPKEEVGLGPIVNTVWPNYVKIEFYGMAGPKLIMLALELIF